MSESKVAILICTYNGEKYLEEQLESFFSQTHRNWELWVSDDGSIDRSKEIIKSYQNLGKDIYILDGPKQGFAKNFLSLTRAVNSTAKYFAWADQDDIWLNNKLERSVIWLDKQDQNLPCLYCGRTLLVDMDNNELGLSPLFKRPPSFKNAICQSIAGGNTMVFNVKVKKLFDTEELLTIPSHDWWCYILVTAANGLVYYDSHPLLRYRQHANNLVGTNLGWKSSLLRLNKLLHGNYKNWNQLHYNILVDREELFSLDNYNIFLNFTKARLKSNFLKRFYYLYKSNVHRQSFIQNFAIYLACFFNKL